MTNKNTKEILEKQLRNGRRMLAFFLGVPIVGGLVALTECKKQPTSHQTQVNSPTLISFTNNAVPALGTNSVNSVSPSFEEAKTNANVRQKFLDNLLATNTIPYSEEVVYDHDGSGIINQYYKFLNIAGASKEDAKMIGSTFESLRGGKFDVKTPEALELRSRGLKTKIFVGREVFEEGRFGYMNAEDFKHLIVSHAGRHAERYSKGSSYLSTEKAVQGVRNGTLRPQVLYALDDYDATANDLRNIKSGQFKVSQIYSNSHNASFLKAGLLLTVASKSASPLELEAINTLQKQITTFPELLDVQVPPKYYEDMKRFK